MEITEIIKKNLSAMGEDYDSLKPFMQERLIKVEESIQNRVQTQEETVTTLKNIDYSVTSISEEIGASRGTMYNHGQLLKRYVEYSASIANSSNPFITIEKLQKEKSVIQEQNHKLMDRDVDLEILKMENRRLNTTLEGKNTEIKRLEERNKVLSEENHRLKLSGKRTPTGNITAFRKK